MSVSWWAVAAAAAPIDLQVGAGVAFGYNPDYGVLLGSRW